MGRTKRTSASLTEVANRAGVTSSTVSRVLHQSGPVAPETRARILRAMRELNIARPHDMLVGLVIPEPANPFMARLMLEVDQSLAELGAQLITHNSNGDLQRELDILEGFQNLHVRAIVYVPSDASADALRMFTSLTDVPIVLVDRRADVALDSVVINSNDAILKAMKHLVGLGHKTIGFVSGHSRLGTSQERQEAVERAADVHRIKIKPQHCFQGDFTAESGEAAANWLMKLDSKVPSAVFVANDLMALAMMSALQSKGWRLPERLSVVGYDDIEWAKWSFPALTTIAQPLDRVGSAVAKRILARTKGQVTEPPGVVTEIPARFVLRASTAKPAAGARHSD